MNEPPGGERIEIDRIEIEGVIFLEYDGLLSAERRTFVSEQLHRLEAQIGKRLVLLDSGVKVARPYDEQLNRIEGKLDRLLSEFGVEDPDEASDADISHISVDS